MGPSLPSCVSLWSFVLINLGPGPPQSVPCSPHPLPNPGNPPALKPRAPCLSPPWALTSCAGSALREPTTPRQAQSGWLRRQVAARRPRGHHCVRRGRRGALPSPGAQPLNEPLPKSPLSSGFCRRGAALVPQKQLHPRGSRESLASGGGRALFLRDWRVGTTPVDTG